jgi:hypothetical protein
VTDAAGGWSGENGNVRRKWVAGLPAIHRRGGMPGSVGSPRTADPPYSLQIEAWREGDDQKTQQAGVRWTQADVLAGELGAPG